MPLSFLKTFYVENLDFTHSLRSSPSYCTLLAGSTGDFLIARGGGDLGYITKIPQLARVNCRGSVGARLFLKNGSNLTVSCISFRVFSMPFFSMPLSLSLSLSLSLCTFSRTEDVKPSSNLFIPLFCLSFFSHLRVVSLPTREKEKVVQKKGTT